jgi:hypothetical protein
MNKECALKLVNEIILSPGSGLFKCGQTRETKTEDFLWNGKIKTRVLPFCIYPIRLRQVSWWPV